MKKSNIERGEDRLNPQQRLGWSMHVIMYHDKHYNKPFAEYTDSADIPHLPQNDKLSSIRIKNAIVTLYEHSNYQGNWIVFSGDVDINTIDHHGWNDKASSAKIRWNTGIINWGGAKEGCCDIFANSFQNSFKNEVCYNNGYKPGTQRCKDLLWNYCKNNNWNGYCMAQATKNENITQAKQQLGEWCSNVGNRAKNPGVCKCWDSPEFLKYQQDIRNKCVKAGGTASCDYVYQMAPHCTWLPCRQSSGFDIYNKNAAQCPDTVIQNCISSINAGGSVNTDSIVSNCFGKDAVHGGWSTWSDWGECNAECDGGTQTRTRKCDNPVPKNGGKPCEGLSVEERECNIEKCNPLDSIIEKIPSLDIKMVIIMASIIMIIGIVYILVKKTKTKSINKY